MKKRTLTFVFIIALCIAASAAVLSAGRKEDDENTGNTTGGSLAETKKGTEKIDYSGMGNDQGNIENGGRQTYLENRGILVSVLDNSKLYMACFNESTQELEFFCTKKGCLHTGGNCVTVQPLSYLMSYSSTVFAVPFSDNSGNEIWKVRNNERECFYRADNEIWGIWGYGGWLYYMTEFGVFRVSMEKPSGVEKVLERPVLYEYLTFYGDKMYFCEEDRILYRANIDGSNKERFCDGMALSPQIYGGFLYYRSSEYDENGKWEIENTLKRISLADGTTETVADEVYLFNIDVNAGRLYYTDLPGEGAVYLNVMDLKDGKTTRITECSPYYLFVCSESNWIVFEREEGEQNLAPGEIAGKPTHLYCIRKDGSGEKRLDYPHMITDEDN